MTAIGNSMRKFALTPFAMTIGVLAAWIACGFALLAPVASAHEPDAEEVALGSLTDAELAFARMAAQHGVRAAFLANFASDGVALEPQPVRVVDALGAKPPPADPLAFRLDWAPAQSGVARSHDFGYTTGPSTAWNAARPADKRHGVFFSVWEKDAKGKWKVILDAGISTLAEVDFAELRAAPRPAFRGKAVVAAERRRLLAREASGLGTNGAITPTRYAQVLMDNVRLQRNGAPPLASRPIVARAIADEMLKVFWTPRDARIARSGDMAVTYGDYRETDRESSREHAGYYAHLWLRDRAGHWLLAYDIALPVGP